jgi:hypothetical protein
VVFIRKHMFAACRFAQPYVGMLEGCPSCGTFALFTLFTLSILRPIKGAPYRNAHTRDGSLP